MDGAARSRLFAAPAGAAVLAVWAAMSLAALWFVFAFGRDVPWEDDWSNLVPMMCGEWPLLRWLWAQQNEHRIPVSRLILWLLAGPTGFDSRAGMVFDAAQFSLLSLAMIWVAARARGRALLTDAIFPLALLHFGHWWNFLMNIQVYVVSATALLCVLFLFVHAEGWRRTGWVLAIAATAILLPLHGGNGLFVVPPCAALMLTAGGVRWHERTPRARAHAAVLAGAALISIAIVPLYFRGLILPNAGAPIRLWPTAVTAAQFLSQGFGIALEGLWKLPALIVFAFLVATAALLVRAWLQRPEDQLLIAGYAACLAALGLLALAVGHGRSGQFHGGLPVRLLTPAATLPLCLYLIWDRLGSGRARTAVQWALLAMFLVLAIPTAMSGIESGRARRDVLEAFERDVRAGMTPDELAATYYQRIFPWSEERLSWTIGLLEREKLGPFRE